MKDYSLIKNVRCMFCKKVVSKERAVEREWVMQKIEVKPKDGKGEPTTVENWFHDTTKIWNPQTKKYANIPRCVAKNIKNKHQF